MNLQHLEYVLAIHRCGSMKGAADLCFVTQPTVSKAVKAIEEEFDIQLIVRRRGPHVIFTAEGEEFLRRSQRILKDFYMLQNHFPAHNSMRLNIASQHYVFVVEAFTRLMQGQHPDAYHVQLKEMTTREILDEVSLGTSSIGIISRTKRNDASLERMLRQRELEFTALGMFDFHAFLAASHPLAQHETLTLSELLDYPFVCYSQHDYSQTDLEEGFIPSNEKIIRVRDRDTMYRLMASVHAYSIGTGTLRACDAKSSLCSIPLSDITEKIRIGWVSKVGSQLSALEESFIELCIEELNRHRLYGAFHSSTETS